ncbi:MAG TPA: ATP-binding protein, partial [Microbacterium sp.]|nr:ATP-binding protein [Microbacterium sp.]
MPSLNPAVAEIRLAVRTALAELPDGATVLVALSGGADSLALTAATVFEARARGMKVLSVTVDHQLQDGSDRVAATAAVTAESIGVTDALQTKVEVSGDGDGMEAA